MTTKRGLVRLLTFYKRWISPALPPVCRYHPSCAEYARDAIEVHGVARGVALAARRLARCHPWCPGGFDPVPPACEGPRLARTARGAQGGELRR
jgi:putative membrane protein insertion efficiency factor